MGSFCFSSTIRHMKEPALFLMLGYPGAGKTTTSKLIAKLTGAKHLWADHERRAMFVDPTHSKTESDQLYAQLNKQTEELLSQGHSVVFDTSFNHFADREYLRRIAAKHNARVLLIWLDTSLATAKSRAVDKSHAEHNKYSQSMSDEEFNRIARHLEPPRPQESAIEFDGNQISEQTVEAMLRSNDVL